MQKKIFSRPSVTNIFVALVVFGAVSARNAQATIVFGDNFDRANSTSIGSTAGPGAGTWTESYTPTVASTGNPGDISISGNLVLVDHNVDDAIYQVSVPTAGFLAPWSNVLSSNPGTVTWNFNMQSSRPSLSGFNPLSAVNSVGMVLCATGTGLGSVNGYAVFWGQANADPIRLVQISGLTNTDIITAAVAPFNNMGTNYNSFRVEYEPSTNLWSFYGRDDGTTAFADPATGSYTLLGTVVNSVHTSAPMLNMGMVGQYTSNGAGDLYRYDNISVEVVPEPSAIVAMSLGVVGLAVGALRRRNKSR